MFRHTKLPGMAAVASLMFFALHGCQGKGDDSSTGGDDSGLSGDAGQTDEPVCTEPKELACEDALILQLGLQDDESSDGDVQTTMDGDDFITTVDATAGGINQAATSPWVYFRFTPDGAEKVEIPDTEALERMDAAPEGEAERAEFYATYDLVAEELAEEVATSFSMMMLLMFE